MRGRIGSWQDLRAAGICMPNIAAWRLTRRRRRDEVARRARSSPIHPDSELFIPDSRQAWVTACARGADRLARQRRHVVGRGRAAGGAGRFRRDPRAPRRWPSPWPCWASASAASLTGKITDRFGIVTAMALSIGILGLGYVGAGLSTIALAVHRGAFPDRPWARRRPSAPLMAEASHWFDRYRGLAVTIVASGNYIGGTIWPPLINLGHAVDRLAHHPYRDRRFHGGRRWRWR